MEEDRISQPVAGVTTKQEIWSWYMFDCMFHCVCCKLTFVLHSFIHRFVSAPLMELNRGRCRIPVRLQRVLRSVAAAFPLHSGSVLQIRVQCFREKHQNWWTRTCQDRCNSPYPRSLCLFMSGDLRSAAGCALQRNWTHRRLREQSKATTDWIYSGRIRLDLLLFLVLGPMYVNHSMLQKTL